MVTLKDVWAARERMGESVVRSRCAPSYAISRLTGSKVWLKFENMQMTG